MPEHPVKLNLVTHVMSRRASFAPIEKEEKQENKFDL